MDIAMLKKPPLVVHTQHLLDLPDRSIFFRKLGSGPPLILIHMSPLDSSHVLALAERLAASFTCLIPDSPGYGNSNPLPTPDPKIADYAAGIKQFTDALGISQCYLYGSHTGAKIGLEFAYKNTKIVKGLILDGLRITSAEQRAQRKAAYAPRIIPVAAGTHLIETWQRVLKTSAAWFVPNSKFPANPQLLNLMRSEIQAKPWYGQAYQAAFTYDPEPVLADYQGSSLFLARDVDQLSLNCITKLPNKSNIHSAISHDDGTETYPAQDIEKYIQKHCQEISDFELNLSNPNTYWKKSIHGVSKVSKGSVSKPTNFSINFLSVLGNKAKMGYEIEIPGIRNSFWHKPVELTATDVDQHFFEICKELGLEYDHLTTHLNLSSEEIRDLVQLLEFIQSLEPTEDGSFLESLWHQLRILSSFNKLLPDEKTSLILDLLSLASGSEFFLKILIEKFIDSKSV